MTFYANDVHPVPPDRCADDCDDQLPLIARVGRGLKGDSARVRISDPDTISETHLESGYYDASDGTWHSDWTSENINGGHLYCQYNLRPYTDPRTFTITFVYKRPGRPEWSWTSPAIPYIWSLDPSGKPNTGAEDLVGSGVATVFIKTNHGDWTECLNYPPGTNRNDFNAPQPGEGWSATIRLGKGGDIEIPDFDDVAKVIGITKSQLFDILDGRTVTINGINARNVIDYVDKKIASVDVSSAINDALNNYWKKIYPVGSLYLSFSSTSPQTLFGGTWQQITGRYLRAANDTNIGGSDSHKLSKNELPQHAHLLNPNSSSGNAIFNNFGDVVAREVSLQPGSNASAVVVDSSPVTNMYSSIYYSGGLGSVNGPDSNYGNSFDIMPQYQDIYVWRRTA